MIDLTHPMHAGIPVAPILPCVEFEPIMRLPADVANVTMCRFPSHAGTHVDAPRHFIPDGRTVDQIPLDWLCRPAMILDLPRDRGEAITGKDLEARAGDIAPGEMLFLRTGFGGRYLDPGYVEHAYLTEDAARWLVARGVRALGVDTVSADMPHYLRPKGFDFPVHHVLLGAEVLIIENLNLERVAGQRLPVTVLPLLIRGGDGAPVRAVAHPPGDAKATAR